MSRPTQWRTFLPLRGLEAKRWSKGLDALPAGPDRVVREMRKGVDVTDEVLYDHITPRQEDDRQIFEQMDASTKYTDLPEELRRYRDDIFTDKYKRLNWSQPIGA